MAGLSKERKIDMSSVLIIDDDNIILKDVDGNVIKQICYKNK